MNTETLLETKIREIRKELEEGLISLKKIEEVKAEEPKYKKVIIGKHLSNTETFYWEYEGNINPMDYDYAIIENKNTIGAVEIVGCGVLKTDCKAVCKRVIKFLRSVDATTPVNE